MKNKSIESTLNASHSILLHTSVVDDIAVLLSETAYNEKKT